MNGASSAIRDIIALSRQMLLCAEQGDLHREDDRCGVLFGMVRDNAYKMIADAEKELRRHQSQGESVTSPFLPT